MDLFKILNPRSKRPSGGRKRQAEISCQPWSAGVCQRVWLMSYLKWQNESRNTHGQGQFPCSGSLFGLVDTRCITELQQNLSSCSRGIIWRITLKGSADIHRLQVTDLSDFGGFPGSPQQAPWGLVQFQQNQSRIPQKHEKFSFQIDFCYGRVDLFVSDSGEAKLAHLVGNLKRVFDWVCW